MKIHKMFLIPLLTAFTIFGGQLASAEDAIVQMVNDKCVIITLKGSGFYIGAKYVWPIDERLREGDAITNVESSHGEQVWHNERTGANIKMEVTRSYMSAEAAIKYYTTETRSISSWLNP